MLQKLLIATLFILTSSNVVVADMQEAQEMFQDAECMSCHNNGDFSPKQEKVKDFHKLESAVQSCQLANSAEWFDDETKDVARYLNKKFYKFKEKKEK